MIIITDRVPETYIVLSTDATDENMVCKASILYLLAAMMLISGCGPNTVSQMKKAGISPLNANSVETLIIDQTLHFEARDFNANLSFHNGGMLSARNNANATDTGTWDITTENMLCLTFKTWYFGDTNCYTLYLEEDQQRYILFTKNGARYYTVKRLNASKVGRLGPKDMTKTHVTNRNTPLNSPNIQYDSDTNRSMSPSHPNRSEFKFLVASTARDCPGCDLSGLDLSESDLSDAILSKAILSGTNLHSSDLRRADLSGADLSGANLTAANLSKATLRNCNLRNADLSGANLTMADFTGSDVTGTILQATHLDRTTGIH